MSSTMTDLGTVPLVQLSDIEEGDDICSAVAAKLVHYKRKHVSHKTPPPASQSNALLSTPNRSHKSGSSHGSNGSRGSTGGGTNVSLDRRTPLESFLLPSAPPPSPGDILSDNEEPIPPISGPSSTDTAIDLHSQGDNDFAVKQTKYHVGNIPLHQLTGTRVPHQSLLPVDHQSSVPPVDHQSSVPPVDHQSTAPSVPPVDHQSTAPSVPPVDHQSIAPSVPPVDHQSIAPSVPPVDHQSTAPSVPPVDHQSIAPSVPPVDHQSIAPSVPPVDHQSIAPSVPPVESTAPSVPPVDHQSIAPSVPPVESTAPSVPPVDHQSIAPSVPPVDHQSTAPLAYPTTQSYPPLSHNPPNNVTPTQISPYEPSNAVPYPIVSQQPTIAPVPSSQSQANTNVTVVNTNNNQQAGANFIMNNPPQTYLVSSILLMILCCYNPLVYCCSCTALCCALIATHYNTTWQYQYADMYGRFALGCNIATVILGMVILACGVIGIGLSVTFTLLIAGSLSSAIPPTPTIPVAYPVTPSFPHND